MGVPRHENNFLVFCQQLLEAQIVLILIGKQDRLHIGAVIFIPRSEIVNQRVLHQENIGICPAVSTEQILQPIQLGIRKIVFIRSGGHR